MEGKLEAARVLPDVDAHAAIGLQRARAHRERLALSGEPRGSGKAASSGGGVCEVVWCRSAVLSLSFFCAGRGRAAAVGTEGVEAAHGGAPSP